MTRTLDCDDANTVSPIVDTGRCLGDANCVAVCPHDVFAQQPVHAERYDGLSASARFLLSLSGGLQAAVVAAERCCACGLCVAVCSQQALTLHVRGEE
jgi:NAD-dependent dihydropyrimidine dehydrogenase PreA subunit